MKVKVERLSACLQDRRRIDLFKIDVEGSEQAVLDDLDGSGNLKQIERIAMEFHYVQGSTTNVLSRIINILENNNYVFAINPDRLIEDVATPMLMENAMRYVLIIDAYRPKGRRR